MDEFSYVVGLVQAKGSFTVHGDGDVSLSLTTPEPEVAHRLFLYIGTGNIRPRTRGGKTESYRYILQRRADVDAVARLLGPQLIGKIKEDAEEVRAYLDSWFDEVDPTSPQRAVKVTITAP